MKQPTQPPRKAFSPWPIIGVLSVLVPALVFAIWGYAAESRRQASVEQRLKSAEVGVVAAAFLDALADGRTEIARGGVKAGADVDVEDQEYRGLQDATVVGVEDDAGDRAGDATVLVEFVTVRPSEAGGPPGVQRKRLVFSREGDRWMIVRVESVD